MFTLVTNLGHSGTRTIQAVSPRVLQVAFMSTADIDMDLTTPYLFRNCDGCLLVYGSLCGYSDKIVLLTTLFYLIDMTAPWKSQSEISPIGYRI